MRQVFKNRGLVVFRFAEEKVLCGTSVFEPTGACRKANAKNCYASELVFRVISVCMKLTLLRWIIWWGSLGLLIPLALILGWKFLGWSFGLASVTFWPSSIMLMGLDGPRPRSASDIAEIYSIAVVSNIALYAVVGVLTWPILQLGQRLWKSSV